MQVRCIALVGAVSLLSGCALPLLMAGPVIGTGAAVYGNKAIANNIERKSDLAQEIPEATERALSGKANQSTIRILRPKYGKHRSSWIADTSLGMFNCSMEGDGVDNQPAVCTRH